MKRFYVGMCSIALALLMVAGVVVAQDGKGAGKDNRMSVATVGATVADFTLPDAEGKKHSLASLKGRNGTVLIFLSTQCPVVRDYIQRIEKLAEDYRAQGVNVVGINSDVTETTDDMKAHAAANHLTFTILKDKGNKIADMLGAERTPEVFFLNADNKLVYHGRIDNHRNLSMVTANDLRDAIDATLAGKPLSKTEASAFGCSIKRAS